MKKIILFSLVLLSLIHIEAQSPIPFIEDFEGYTAIPPGWTFSGDIRYISNESEQWANEGVDWSNCLFGRLGAGYQVPDMQDFHIYSPLIGPIVADSRLRFSYKIISLDFEILGSLWYQVIVNGNVLYTIEGGTHLAACGAVWQGDNFRLTRQLNSWVTVTIPLDDYDTENIQIEIYGDFRSPHFHQYFYLDDFQVRQHFDHDLATVSIDGSITPTLHTPINYKVKVFNDGFLTVDAGSYTVKLLQSTQNGVEELSAVDGITLSPNSTHEFLVSCSMLETGTQSIFASIDYFDDQYAPNDQKTLPVTIYPQGTAVSYIGNYKSAESSNPFTFSWKNSVFQTLYLEEEISATGMIYQINYRFEGSGDITQDLPVKIYLAHTDKTEWNSLDNWIDFADFTLVYTGTIQTSIPATHDILIALDSPFLYTGGNLAILTQRVWETNGIEYIGKNRFQGTLHPEYLSQSRYAMSNTIEVDPANLTSFGLSSGLYYHRPNTTIFISTSDLGHLCGTVTFGGQPVEGAVVSIAGTTRQTITSQYGQYLLSYLPIGQNVVTVTKLGYLDQTFTVNITEHQTTTQDFALAIWPTVNVSGTVFAEDTENTLAGCQIWLTGYDTYQDIYSGIDGEFTIGGVYTNHTYTLTVARGGYATYTDTVMIESADVSLPPITMSEYANRPYNVQATATNARATITWSAPLLGEEKWFTQSPSEEILGAGGFRYPYTHYAAHRFTQVHLRRFGVSGAKLETVSFVPMSTAQFKIQVYIYGSDYPSVNPGMLAYEQDIPFESLSIGQWNEIQLNNVVDIPSGGDFWIVLQIDGAHEPSLGVTVGQPNNWYGNVFKMEGMQNWSPSTAYSSEYESNWAIKGFAIGAESLAQQSHQTISPPTRAFLGYHIYRVDATTIGDPDLWTGIGYVTGTTYIDNTWGSVYHGEFMYAVRAVHSGGLLSSPVFSNAINKDMLTQVNITLSPSDNGEIQYATVKLINNNQNPEQVYRSVALTNVVTFDEVWTGDYTLIITRGAYESYIDENVIVARYPTDYTAILTASNVLLYENFEKDIFPPEDWSLYSLDIDNKSWIHSFHDGTDTYIAESSTINSGISLPYHQNNWLVTSKIHFPQNATSINLSYDISVLAPVGVTPANPDINPDLPNEAYTIHISTTDTAIASFSQIYSDILTNSNATHWETRNIPLANYADNYVYLAFRHYHIYGSSLLLDNVSVTYANSSNDHDSLSIPVSTKLKANYPNPFNPSTTIGFDTDKPSRVYIDIYNVKGQKVKTLVSGVFEAGSHTVQWNGIDDNGRSVGSGVYFYRMSSGDFVAMRKMLLLK